MPTVEKHLAAAKRYIARGEEFYAKAVEEILAAQRVDPTLSNRDVGEWFDRSEEWVRKLVLWGTSPTSSRAPTPYSGEAPAINLRKTKQLLREAEPEQLAEIVASLPRERREEIAVIADNSLIADSPTVERRPIPARHSNADALLKFESALFSARRHLRDALAIANTIETPGEDEDILELLRILGELVSANEESYRSGQSVDTWAWELLRDAS